MTLAFVATTLSACGGATTGGTTLNISQPTLRSPVFNTYSSGLTYIIDGDENADVLGASSGNALNVAGSANYTGALFVGSRTVSTVVDAVVGDMRLEFDLADNTFEGTATDFFALAGGTRAGTLEISNGTVVRSENAITVFAEVSGAVVFGSDLGTTSDRNLKELDGSLSGAFAGEDAEELSGIVDVSYDIEPLTFGTITLDEIRLEGGFAAEAD